MSSQTKIHFSLVLNFRAIYKYFMFQFGAWKTPTLWSSSLLQIAIIFCQYNSSGQI